MDEHDNSKTVGLSVIAPSTPSLLDSTTQVDILKTHQILYGICKTRSDRYSSKLAYYPLCDTTGLAPKDLENLVESFRLSETYSGEVDALTQSEMAHRREGAFELEATVDAPFASFSIGLEAEKQRAESESTENEYKETSETFLYWQVKIRTEELRKRLSQTFLDRLDEALTDSDVAAALKKLFSQWGHVIAREIYLGGERREFFIRASTSRETSAGNSLAVHAAGRVGNLPVVVGPSLAMTSDERVAQNINRNRAAIKFVGGNQEFHSESRMEDWKSSLQNVHAWSVIKRSDAIPIVDLLDATRQNAVKRYDTDRRPLEGHWVRDEEVIAIRCSHFTIYQARLGKEAIDEGWRSLGQSTQAVVLVVRDVFSSGCLKAVEKPREVWKDREWKSMHTDTFSHLRAPTPDFKSLGSFFSGCKIHKADQDDLKYSICAIDRKWLGDAQFDDGPCIERPGKAGRTKSVWKVKPRLEHGIPTTIPLGTFHAFDMEGAPTDAPKGLRVDFVHITNPQDGPSEFKSLA